MDGGIVHQEWTQYPTRSVLSLVAVVDPHTSNSGDMSILEEFGTWRY